jgi:squalene monooxygenase
MAPCDAFNAIVPLPIYTPDHPRPYFIPTPPGTTHSTTSENRPTQHIRMSPPSFNYDIVVVGAGIAGCSFAHSLAASSQKPLKICLLERSLAEPDRIVGEMLQPRGVEIAKRMGMGECLEGIDAVPALGYCVVNEGKNVRIPYPEGYQGRSFHHGRFIMALRNKAGVAPGVEMLERTVTKLIECPYTGKVLGVRALNKPSGSEEGIEEEFYGDLTVVADGCFSNFRAKVMGDGAAKTSLGSHFVGLVLENAWLPYDEHGTVVLVKGYGPVLLYRISKTETRMLIAVRVPLPPDLKVRTLVSLLDLRPR